MAEPQTKQGYQFGTFKGVFMPSVLTVLGVVMYLRLGWVLGNLGLPQTLIVVTIATSITFLTALSISELATNMKVGGGGAYYIISRSLGVEAGAAIGIPLFFAQALGISFYIAGFSESLQAIFPNTPPVIVGVITLVALTVLAYVSADLALKFQFIILALIIISLASFFTGSTEVSLVLPEAFHPEKVKFWAAFAVFFPAVTGIEAGLAMSGDLKNTERSLPLGTFLAIGVSYIVYLAIPICLNHWHVDDSILLSNYFIMKDVARWGTLVLIGLWGAALSSALGALLGAPRTLQALSRDGVLPKWIGRGFGENNDPRIATALSFAIALAGIILGDLNVIAPILSMFFLTSYGLLNFSAAFEGILNNPSWRPKFRVHWGWPFLGFSGCIMVMLMINAGATIIAFLVSALVYYLMHKSRINAYWGDMRYGIFMLLVQKSLYALAQMPAHEKTWRPNILVLSGSPSKRWYLIELADAISHGKGFLTVAAIVPEKLDDSERLTTMQDSIGNYLKERDVPAIVKIVNAEDTVEGCRRLVQNYGFGPLQPNTIMLGEARSNFTAGYASLILTAAQRHRNVIVVCEKETQDRPTIDGRPQIDLWWRRVGDNSGLMLALSYLLKTSPEWEGARMVVKTIVSSDEEKVAQEEQLREFISKENMGAEIEILVHTEGDVYNLIQSSSAGANLIFLGMKTPDEAETPESYSQYYQQLLNKTHGLPTTVLVLAAEPIDFNRIFALRG